MLLVLAFAAVAAGCGGDEGDETITTSSLGKKEFVKQVNAICAKREKEVLDGWEPYFKAHEDDDVPKGVLWANAQKAVMLPPVEAEIEEIRELGAPRGDEDQIEALLVSMQKAVDGTEEIEKVRSVFFTDPGFSRATVLASEYGIGECP